ncbi:MAG: DUF1028 domain-containing protein [Saprospirales bacterium]|nr:MAG: DUF1028 domain-containing protein [Saprospirales bacterium]
MIFAYFWKNFFIMGSKVLFIFTLISGLFFQVLPSQTTYSIVAVDPITGEVGSAGASCVDLDRFGFETDDFVGELFPGEGAINTQAWYIPRNQQNAAKKFESGMSPDQIIQWLTKNDADGNPNLRQYGLVRMVKDGAQAAAFTGDSTISYAGQIVGDNYAIQGNILSGADVLERMEEAFLTTEGDLTCKLLAALEAAAFPGADTRCLGNITSSLFAYLKVAQPSDPKDEPSVLYSVRTAMGDEKEPVILLRNKMRAEGLCR